MSFTMRWGRTGMVWLAATTGACATNVGTDDAARAGAEEAVGQAAAALEATVRAEPAGCPTGVVLERADDGTIELAGRWTGAAAPTSLEIGGKRVTPAANGSWSLRLPARVGLTRFHAKSKDARGGTFDNVCSVHATERRLATTAEHADALLLGLRQRALDDGAPATTLESLGDALRKVLASDALQADLDAELDELRDVDIRAGRYDYRDIRFGAPDVSLDIDTGALEVEISIPDVFIHGKYEFEGPFGADRARTLNARTSKIALRAKVTFRVDAAGAIKADVTVPPNGLTIGTLDLEGEGVIGETVERIGEFLADLFQPILTRKLRSVIESKLGPALSDLLEGAESGGLAARALDLPNLQRAGTTRIGLETSVTSVRAVEGGALTLGIGTKVTGGAASGFVPVPEGRPTFFTGQAPSVCREIDLPFGPNRRFCTFQDTDLGAGAVSLGFVNQILSALHRSDYFRAVSFRAAPTVEGVAGGDAIRVHVGPVAASFTVPVLGAVRGDYYATLRAPLRVSGNDAIDFGDVTVESLEFDPGEDGTASLGAQPAAVSIMRSTLQVAVDTTLDNLRLVKIPVYRIPTSLARYDLPAGARIGVKAPSLETTAGHVVLTGKTGRL